MKKTNEPFGTPDADGWYEWKGDDMVRPAGTVEVIYRNGLEGVISADTTIWSHDPLSGNGTS